MDIIEENEHFIVGVIKQEPSVQYVAVSQPTPLETFSPQHLITIPLRWVRHAQKLKPEQASAFLKRKLRTGNVGRKLRRVLRRAS